MAESQAIESTPEATSIAQHVGRFSDRAIQRLVGGNAFLRGRIYARRNAVSELKAEALQASCNVLIKSDEPITVSAELVGQEIRSQCRCQAWRGPTGHCKHVAALLVALRDRERPPRPKLPDPQQPQQAAPRTSETVPSNGQPQHSVHVAQPQPQPGSGKRRRSRRRRHGGGGAGVEGGALQVSVMPPSNGGAVEMLGVRDFGLAHARRGGNARGGGLLDAWLPSGELAKPCEFEYRLTVRAASITVTPVLAGTRSPVPIADALSAFNTVPIAERPLLRALARHAPRGAPATAELRGEDAAEALSMLRGRRVLLEPASKELRFADGALEPRIELDLANNRAVRIRVVFELGNRRFALSSGAWFEGTPGWHIDTTEGVARPVSSSVTPAWLQRLYRSPALVQPITDLPRLLVEYIPRVAASLGTELPDLSQVADVLDATPKFEIRTTGDIIEARARLKVRYDQFEYDVPPAGFPQPLAF
jgi:hypothetical protein